MRPFNKSWRRSKAFIPLSRTTMEIILHHQQSRQLSYLHGAYVYPTISLSLFLSLPLSVNEINSHISTASIAATMFHFRFHSRPLFPSLYFPLFLSPLLFFHPPSPPRKPKRSICPITHSNNHSNRNSSSIGERKGAEDRSMALLSPR